MAGNSKVSVDQSADNQNQVTIPVDLLLKLLEEQNRLTTDLVKLAEKRNEMADRRTKDAQLRTVLSEKRTALTEKQTEYSSRSTELAEQRTRHSQIRTELAENRTSLAETRTGLSGYRSVLAKGRTELASIRTGLAFVALGAGLMRYFGLGPWTVLDGGLLLAGMVMTLYGLRGFTMINKHEKRFDWKWNSFSSYHSPSRVPGEGE
jgi:uncharacterized membrane protein YidH (DUF202 family)